MERVFVEQRFRLPKIHPRLHGTMDAGKYSRINGGTALVADLKFGAGVAVEVKGPGGPSKQLMTYALGFVEYLRSLGLPVAWVVLAIVQPRYDHPEGKIRTHKVSVGELDDFGKRLKRDLALVDQPGAQLKVGSHCRWCKAKPICPKLAQMVEKALTSPLTGGFFGGRLPYDPQQLAASLKLSETLPAWKKAVHALAYREAVRGRCPPGWKLVPKRSANGGYTLVPESDAREPAVLPEAGSEFDAPLDGFGGA